MRLLDRVGMGSSGDADIYSLSSEVLDRDIAAIFRPVIMGFLVPCMVYYLIIAVICPFQWQGGMAWLMFLKALGSAMLPAWLFWRLRKREASFFAVEMTVFAVSALIYVNAVIGVTVDYNPLKLVYFLLVALLAATAGVSLRVMALAVPVSLATMLAYAYFDSPEVFIRYCLIALAGSFTVIGASLLVRGALLRAVGARLVAERLRARAEYQADYDALTGLPNRRHFFSHIEAIIGGEGPEKAVHVGIIDLDGFKPVNDLYGHAVGDELLYEVAQRIRARMPADAMVARLGGDEFALTVGGALTADEIRETGRTICEALQQPFVISGIGIAISASIGFSHFPTDGSTVRQIYERADHALYRAKRGARGEVVVFSPAYESEMSDTGRIEQVLRAADLERELHVVFQPQHDLMTGRTSGFEALARWQSRVLGPVRPDRFIAAAERSGLIETITGVLLRKTLATVRTWPEDISVSFNLSGLDLMSERSIANVLYLVGEGGVRPDRIMFEITETAMMHDFERARASLQRLAALGCRIALDDFGSGYSSFAYIHRFPLNRIKTDRHFVTEMAEDETVSRNILRAVAELCANIGVECLAEGVETPAELEIIRASGIRFVQGYHFGKPMPAAGVAAFLAASRAPAAAGAARASA